MIPIIALCTALLVGASAVAVDLSLNTHSRRTLQNVTDGAALAGARDITWTANQTGPTHATQVTAVTDALKVLNTDLGWNMGSNWYTTETSACASTVDGAGNPVCQVSGSFQNYTFSVNTPPLSAHQTSFNDDPHYVEVNLTRSHSNNVAGVIGFGSSVEGAHSVAYHFPVNLPFGFALYSSTIAQGGNQGEVVSGPVFSYRDIQPQSSGKSGFCVLGFIVLGSPQYPNPYPSPDPAAGQLEQHDPTFTPKTAQTVQQDTQNCTNTPGGYVAQSNALGSCPPVNIQGSTLQTTYDATYSHACVATSNPPAPTLIQPTWDPVNYPSFSHTWNAKTQGTFQITGPLIPGVYKIVDGGFCNNAPTCADVLIDGQRLTSSGCKPGDASYYNLCLYGVTFILENGATIHMRNKANVLLAPPFYPGYPGTPLSTNNKSDGHIPIYAASGNAVSVVLDDLSVTLVLTGTIYMPTGTMVDQQNATLVITGQAIVQNWQVQTGNQTNPVLTYDATQAAPQPEILRLAE